MSTSGLFRFSVRLFCLLLFLSVEPRRIDGAPTTTTRVPSNNNNKRGTSTAKSDARLLGRLSLMAGLGSPPHHRLPPLIPYNNRQGSDLERVSSSSRPMYKLPLAHSGWAPYLAAIYEPPPLYSLFQDPLGYLAALLNPSINLFTGGDSRTAADYYESTTPMGGTSSSSSSGGNEDIIVMFNDSDNEIPDEGRKMLKTDSLFESRMDKTEDGSRTTETTKATIATTNSIASEKSTVTPTESNRRQDDGETTRVTATTNAQSGTRRPPTRPSNFNNNNRRPGGRPTGPQLKPMRRPTPQPTTTQDPQGFSTLQNQSGDSVDEDYPTDTSAPTTTTTTMATNSTAVNSTTPASNATLNGYHGGYYYYGHHRQNVSHVVFTTPRAETIQPTTESLVPLNLGGGGDTDRFFAQQQQQGPIYHDYEYQSPIARFDYNNPEEPYLQQPPIEYAYHPHHPAEVVPGYPASEHHPANEHLHHEQERPLNGFRPSVPYYVFK